MPRRPAPVLVRRRPNPIPEREARYLLDPWSWVEGTVMEDFCQDEETAGFFHVTTQADKVFSDGRLRSRRDVGGMGLGGGTVDPGHHVSFVLDLQRARWLWSAIRGLRLAMEAQRPDEALRLVLDWTEFPSGLFGERFEEFEEDGVASDLVDLAEQLGLEANEEEAEAMTSRAWWDEAMNRQRVSLAEAWGGWSGPYELVQTFEEAMRGTFLIRDEDRQEMLPTVGFTARPGVFRQIDPAQITIVQAAVLPQCAVQAVVDEGELRVRPDQIQIVKMGLEHSDPLPIEPRPRRSGW